MRFVKDDGGRAEAGFRGGTGDCTVRAIAIAAEVPYHQVYHDLDQLSREIGPRRGKVRRDYARTGVRREIYQHYLAHVLGWTWTPTMEVGKGCQVHLREDELPQGRIICRVSHHHCAVIDGVIHDMHDPSRDGTRCVYGYWSAP